ncbi:MAG: YsnF/AvaK domain-containing protein [Winkia neuii]|uniref:DUF2382 domain-containing protein n=1 Tax=Winkia neuii TaxID=33007 RepID=A0A2I1IM51_9ACTO|nr:YsnF/AvaK domain-containing protein [Winkia neuii]OFJ70704.1 photosystem reaction center subunit H [Actinomyces sp. HMSC064C12]OFK02448.1 photosystem reaction center subunit H [Actinomyces sp. HMSC072A03]OFT53902.1 photosystem reaction center subunit H [Actinomyces sp. HMSC06A08]KWZ74975.1 hypothetical protein HMPREF3198_00619 [Winkia neuii]MDK8099177.1 YsnF/AvaK domain-containing protein [Winkia neuii]
MTTHSIEELAAATAFDSNGDKLGDVKQVFTNDATGQPDFIEVAHGLFGLGSSLVPLRGHRLDDEGLHLAFAKDRIKDAPDLAEAGHLTPEDQDALYRHYGVDQLKDDDTTRYGKQEAGEGQRREAAAGAPVAAGAPAARHTEDHEAAGRHRAEETKRDARPQDKKDIADDGEIIRSEEQLNVAKERVATGQAQLRKNVVTETETVEVPVEREEVRLVRTPINEDEAKKLGNQDISEGEASVTLHEDRVNVSKESVPVEKISLGKETVKDTKTVSEDLKKEQIETNFDEGKRK